MLKISHFTVEDCLAGCVTDHVNPVFAFCLESDQKDTAFAEGRLEVAGVSFLVKDPTNIVYQGPALKPFTVYEARVFAKDNHGEEAEGVVSFETGRMNTPWAGKWISDPSYHFTEKGTSPKPMYFKKDFAKKGAPVSVKLYATALGIYDVALNGKKLGERYFAPGYTSYKTNLAYQVYDITKDIQEKNTLIATVAGGWAISEFIYSRTNRYDGDRQAFLCEIRATYADGSVEVIASDTSFSVSEEGPVSFADFYDGETYNAQIDEAKIAWKPAGLETLRVHPSIFAEEGTPVKAIETRKPVNSFKGPHGETIYDFAQNFAGVVSFNIHAKPGQKIVIRHAEVLNHDGSLNLGLLRTAKSTITYIARGGEESFSPTLTYMGFRYASVEGIDEKDIELSALVLSSATEQIGDFECSDKRLNQLNQNVLWSAKSNLMDIPTDCPQRDERMGWTGDISMFASTACANFPMRRFLEKWLRDLRAEQLKTGGLPNVIPSHGYGFPVTMPVMAVDFWGDASLNVPWALYMAYGDKAILEESYDSMKRYVKACEFWAKIWGVGDYRYIWHTPAFVHFGDWVSPDAEKMSEWQGRSKYTATASLCHTSHLLSQIATILGKKEDAATFEALSKRVAKAYRDVFTDKHGKLKKEFQTAYVLPLAFDMLPEAEKKAAVDNLVALVEKAHYCIGTGFPGTPYILFVLADNGHADVAYKMLLNEQCPSWLYAVKMGASTIWEKFDGLDEQGYCRPSKDGTDNMISFNHYASGSVAGFLYRRVAGVEALKPGYQEFQVKPLLGGGISSASFMTQTPYGKLMSHYSVKEGQYNVEVTVPVSCVCHIVLPSGKLEKVGSGTYTFSEAIHA